EVFAPRRQARGDDGVPRLRAERALSLLAPGWLPALRARRRALPRQEPQALTRARLAEDGHDIHADVGEGEGTHHGAHAVSPGCRVTRTGGLPEHLDLS